MATDRGGTERAILEEIHSRFKEDEQPVFNETMKKGKKVGKKKSGKKK